VEVTQLCLSEERTLRHNGMTSK